MSEKQDEYEEIDAIYQEEKKQLVELEQRFSTLEVFSYASFKIKHATCTNFQQYLING